MRLRNFGSDYCGRLAFPLRWRSLDGWRLWVYGLRDAMTQRGGPLVTDQENSPTPLPPWAMSRQSLEDGYAALQERLEAAEAALEERRFARGFLTADESAELQERTRAAEARAEAAERLNGELVAMLNEVLDNNNGVVFHEYPELHDRAEALLARIEATGKEPK